MNNYLEKFDKSLTDTKSRVNKCSENYIQPKLKVMFDDYASERGTWSGSASISEHAIGSDSMEQKCTLLIYKMYEFTLKEPGVKFLSKNLAIKFGLTLNAP